MTTQKELEKFLEQCINYVGLGFHPDTDFAEYVDTRNGQPLFSPEQAERYNENMEDAFDYCNANGLDIYEISMELL